jgi:hypothetical protein
MIVIFLIYLGVFVNSVGILSFEKNLNMQQEGKTKGHLYIAITAIVLGFVGVGFQLMLISGIRKVFKL